MANTKGEKELKTSWDEQTAADETKRVGHVMNLIPQEPSLVNARDCVGID